MALVLPEGKGNPIREEFLLGPVDCLGGLVVIAQRVELDTRARSLVEEGICYLKLLIYDLPDGYS